MESWKCVYVWFRALRKKLLVRLIIYLLLTAAAFRLGGIWNAICLLHLDRWPIDHNLAILDTDINVGRDVDPRGSRSIHYDDDAEFHPRVRVRELDSRARPRGDACVLAMEILRVAEALHL